jgi:hypothetical protein
MAPAAFARQNAGMTQPALLPEPLAPVFWEPDRLGVASAWWGHVPFAHWLMAAMQPGLVVELGTHTGVSYAAFCKAVAELGLKSQCVAVDTWRGDAQAGQYGEAVFQELAAWHDQRHGRFSRLLRAEFDVARRLFGPGSVDLLHIDGLHDEASVRHDLETWLPAMSARGVVLFHDTEVRGEGWGVGTVWDAARRRWPGFGFRHCYGLGLLAVGARPDPAVAALCAAEGTAEGERLRRMFEVAGERWMLEQAMRQAQAAARLTENG